MPADTPWTPLARTGSGLPGCSVELDNRRPEMEKEDLAELTDLVRELIDEMRELRSEAQR